MKVIKRAGPITSTTAAPPLRQGKSLLGAGLLGLLVGLAMAAGVLALRTGGLSRQEAGASPRLTTAAPPETSPLPWGELVSQRITIERPAEYLQEFEQFPAQATWFVGGGEVARWQAVLAAAQLSAGQQQDLAASNRWEAVEAGWLIHPSSNTIDSLTRQARSQIYAFLARFPENSLHASPYRFPRARESEWFANSGLSPQLEDQVKKLLYESGQTACFADMHLLSRMANRTERHQLIRVLSRQPAVFAKLRVHEAGDVERILQYWEKARPRSELEPLLKSLIRSAPESEISLAFCLPPFARTRLYCYPDQIKHEPNSQDCYWTALNFFNLVPDPRFLDPDLRDQILMKDYQAVTTPALGDVMLLLDQSDRPVHACVYLADKIVFTKNGVSRFAPWLLMDLDDMLALYREQYVRVIALRPKVTPKPPARPKFSLFADEVENQDS